MADNNQELGKFYTVINDVFDTLKSKRICKDIFTIKVILHLANPYLEPLVVLAVVVRDDVHQLEVEHADDDQAVDDPIFGELQAGVPVLVWKNK